MTHCRKCGVWDDLGESIICEECADNLNSASDYFSAYDIACAALFLGLVIVAIDIGIIVVWEVMKLV